MQSSAKAAGSADSTGISLRPALSLLAKILVSVTSGIIDYNSMKFCKMVRKHFIHVGEHLLQQLSQL